MSARLSSGHAGRNCDWGTHAHAYVIMHFTTTQIHIDSKHIGRRLKHKINYLIKNGCFGEIYKHLTYLLNTVKPDKLS